MRIFLNYYMKKLYADEKAFGGEWNKWGYEMTIKLNEETDEDCMWAIDMLSNLARYTYTQKRFFQPYEYISGGGKSLHTGVESNITALLTISDTEAQTQDTLYGKTEFRIFNFYYINLLNFLRQNESAKFEKVVQLLGTLQKKN